MKETLIIIVLVMLAMFVMVLLSAFEEIHDPIEHEQTTVFCDRPRCRHTDCQYHPAKADDTHIIRADLMWTMVCPHYRWTEDLDDPEG